MTTIGFIGAGQLGEPMVLRLLAAGHRVMVFARREDIRARLRERGALLAGSVATLAAESDILISCLFSDAQLRQVALGADGFMAHLRPGLVVVSHTTGTRANLDDVAKAGSSTVTVLDAPVSGTAEDIANGTLTVLIGGDSAAVQRVRPVLAAYAHPIVETGPLGSALDIKLINNVLFAANAQLVAAAVQVGERLGVAPDALLSALAVCSGDSNVAAHVRGVGGLTAFVDRATPFLRKDVSAAIAAAQSVGSDLGLLQSVVIDGPLDLT